MQVGLGRYLGVAFAFLLPSRRFSYDDVPSGQAPHAGWFADVPDTAQRLSPRLRVDVDALALLLLTIPTALGPVHFSVTSSGLRAPGMPLGIPLFLHSTTTVSFSIPVSLPALTAALAF
jgi:heme/copper-type cytochrome/quinol oxidase subunit 1